MKILYWTQSFWPDIGGVEVLAMKTLPELQKRNYEFVVITSHCERDLPDEMKYDGIPVHRFPFWKVLSKRDPRQVVKVQKQIAQLKRSFKPDLVHLHYPGHIAYFHLSTADTHPVPTLLTVHTDFYGLRGDQSTLFGQTLRSAAWVTACSEATLSDAIRIVPDILSRSTVIHNGIDAPKLTPEPLSFEEPRILCLGRLVQEKGFDVAISAFALLANRFPRARLTIAGDGPVRDDLTRQTVALGLTDAVEFKGWVSPEKIPDLINNATIVVIPSRYREPFGLVAVEAAQMARPVVATRIGGLSEVVVDKETGLLFDKEDNLALADAITFLLESPDKAKLMGHAARARALEVFSLEKFVDAYDRLYLKLIEESPRPV